MVVTSRCFAFRALITQARIWKRFWVEKFDKFTLFTHFLVGWNLKHSVPIFFRLSWPFKREKPVRISLLISALKKRVLPFFSGKLYYESNRKLFSRVCITWYKHSRVWENSRQLFKPSTSSLVCMTVSNSPNPFRVYIRPCKHGKRLLLLNKLTFWATI